MKKNENLLVIRVGTGVAFIGYIFQDALICNTSISFISQLDEITAVLCLVGLLFYVAKNHFVIKINIVARKMLTCIIFMIFMGIMSSLLHRYQTLPYALLDMLTCAKFFLGFGFMSILVCPKISPLILQTLAWCTKISIIFLALLCIHDEFLNPIFPYFTETFLGFELRSLYLVFSNPTYLASTGVSLLVLLFITERYHKYFKLLLFACVIIVAASTRSKALGFLCIALLLYYISKNGRVATIKKRLMICIPLGLLGMTFIAWDKIILYFFNSNHYSPRSILLSSAIQFAAEAFPFGYGYGTFCTVASLMNLSPLYEKISYLFYDGSSGVYDVFWGALLGEFGFLGAAAFCGAVMALLVYIQKHQKYCVFCWLAALFALLYLLIASIGESSFFSQYAITYGALIALACKTAKSPARKEWKSEKNIAYQ